ncbi:MAG: translation initiation factor IF-2 [Acidiferrobacterales bacterium]|nr:translation initiation factor IF-2 [Acidiferrobacterales bacterium]
MTESLKNLAESFEISEDRLIMLFEEAGVAGITGDSNITPMQKIKLVKSMQTGRVQIKTKKPSQSVESQGRTGAKREVKIEVVDGSVIVPRGIPAPLVDVPDTPKEKEEETTAEAEEQPPQGAQTEDQEAVAAPDEATEPTAGEQVKPETDEAPEEAAQADVQQPVEVPQPIIEKKEPGSGRKTPKKAKGKRKSAAKEDTARREQLHIARGRKKPSRDRVRRSKAPLSDDHQKKHRFTQPVDPIVVEVAVSDSNKITELAKAMSVKAPELIKKLFEVSQIVTINDTIDKDTANYLVEEMGHRPTEADSQDLEATLINLEADDREMHPRSPVVAVMGHVDHGKTTLLDHIRSTKVAEGEKGGITQHIGAYVVKTTKGSITFFDTPGHEAFSEMRVRGAKATDIVILVVAADDGVKPQTVEAINHARSANVPVIVAINKIDKDKSSPDKVLRELTEHDVIVEDFGGDVLYSPVSALRGTGVNELLEMVELQSEVLDLTAPTEGIASGVVIEARVDRGLGAVVTVLVQKGNLMIGNHVVAGVQKARVRTLRNDRGTKVKSAGPSTPVEIIGFQEIPAVGESFICVQDDKTAQQLIDYRNAGASKPGPGPIELTFGDSDSPKILNIVIKADVRGSAEALSTAIANLSNEEVEIRVIHSMVGGISKSDVNLATPADAIIIAFNVRAEATAKQEIDSNNIKVIYCGVIYDAIDAMKELIASNMKPVTVEEIIAQVEVREVFKFPKVGTIAGCYVSEGTVRNHLPVRVLRNNIMIHNGVIDSLRRFKNDVPEVKAGMECGIQVRNYHDIHTDDQLEIYQSKEVSHS